MTAPLTATSTRILDVVIVIPSYNEEEAISDVIGDIRAHCDYTILVVDDASTDRTADRAREAGATVIPLAVRLGAWGATQTGLRYALRQDYKAAVTMDADGQHEALAIDSLLRPVLAGSADIVIGACTNRGTALRRFAWRVMKRASGLSLEDITSGFRAYNRASIRELARRPATLLEYQDIGVLLLLHKRGLTIKDVGVHIKPRREGQSRIFHSRLFILYYMVHTILLGLSKRRMTGDKPRSTR